MSGKWTCQSCGGRPDYGFHLCSRCANPPCIHGTPNGDQPDPWRGGRAVCHRCATHPGDTP